MREREVERRLVTAVKKLGGLAPKFTSPGLDGVPDRLVLLPDGRMRPLQLLRKRQLEELGFRVYCIDRPEQIGGVLDEIQAP